MARQLRDRGGELAGGGAHLGLAEERLVGDERVEKRAVWIARVGRALVEDREVRVAEELQSVGSIECQPACRQTGE